MSLTLADFDFHLPPELIAQHPAPQRSDSRLLVVDRASQTWRHHTFAELPDLLHQGDLLVANDTRVFPARLKGNKASGGRVELLLHHLPEPAGQGAARARATCRGRLRVGQVLHFGPDLAGEITAVLGSGVAEVEFRSARGDVVQAVLARGEVPLPPYIRRAPGAADQERYQTVYAAHPGPWPRPRPGCTSPRRLWLPCKTAA